MMGTTNIDAVGLENLRVSFYLFSKYSIDAGAAFFPGAYVRPLPMPVLVSRLMLKGRAIT